MPRANYVLGGLVVRSGVPGSCISTSPGDCTTKISNLLPSGALATSGARCSEWCVGLAMETLSTSSPFTYTGGFSTTTTGPSPKGMEEQFELSYRQDDVVDPGAVAF